MGLMEGRRSWDSLRVKYGDVGTTATYSGLYACPTGKLVCLAGTTAIQLRCAATAVCLALLYL